MDSEPSGTLILTKSGKYFNDQPFFCQNQNSKMSQWSFFKIFDEFKKMMIQEIF